MANNQKRKGDEWERNLADWFTKKLGISVMRSLYTSDPMVRKGKGNSDLIGTPQLAVEAKRTETFEVHKMMAQARRNAGKNEMPCVIHRRSRQSIEDAHVVMRLDDFTRIYRDWCEKEGYCKPEVKRNGERETGAGEAEHW